MTIPNGGAANIWRDLVGGVGPDATDPHQPIKSEIRSWGAYLEGKVGALYGTRAAFVAAVAAGDHDADADGTRVFDGTSTYEKLDTATTIADIPDWVPVAPFRSQQYNIVSGGVDQTTKMQALFDYVASVGGGHILMEKTLVGFSVAGNPVIEENLIVEWQTMRVDDNSAPSVVLTANTAGIIKSRGSKLMNFYAKVAAAVDLTYSGKMIKVEQGGADANIGAPVIDHNIALQGGTGRLADGYYCDEKETFAACDFLYCRNLKNGIHLKPKTGEWVNGNTFTNIFGFECENFIKLDSTDGEVAANVFRGGWQADATVAKRGYQAIGDSCSRNIIDVHWWDVPTMTPKDGEVSVCVIDLGGSLSRDNVVMRSPGPEYVINRTTGLYQNYIQGTVDSPISGYIAPNSGRLDSLVDFSNSNFAYAGDTQNTLYTPTGSTVTGGSIAAVFDPSSSSSNARWLAGGTDEWKAVSVKVNAGTQTVLKGLLAVFGETVPLEIQFWYSNLASPTFSQLEGAEGSITDWTKLTKVFRETNEAVYTQGGQLLFSAQHYAVRFLVPAGLQTALEDFCAVLPDYAERRYIERSGGSLFGNLNFLGGVSAAFVSSNGAGSASLLASNSNHLDITATGGVRLAGTKILGNQGAAIADVPTAGSATAAANATAINSILARLRAHGLIAT